MCDRINNWLFETPKITNRIWETDKLSKKALMILRSAGFLIIFEANVLNFVVYIDVNGLKVFSLTSITLIFSLFTYGFIMLELLNDFKSDWTWKVGHILFEIFISCVTALTAVFIALLVFWILSVESRESSGGWIEITVKVQLHTVIAAVYLLDFYTNRIEFSFRHITLVICAVLLILATYIGFSGIDSSIDDYFDWSDLGTIGFVIAAGVLFIAIFCFAVLFSQHKKRRYLIKPQSKKYGGDKMIGTVHISFDNV